MTATFSKRDIRRSPLALDEGEQESPGILLDGVSWELYEQLLDVVGDRSIRLTFDDGELEIMSPLREHEKCKKVIGGMIEVLSLELNIPIEPVGSTTFRRKLLAKGLEPDESYYIQHEPEVRGSGEIDLKRDPPPDLAVEIDITHRAIDRERIYAALGIPELWRFDGEHLSAFRLTSGRPRVSRLSKAERQKRKYVPISKSLCFPFLTVADLEPFVKKAMASGYTVAIRAFRNWIRHDLKPPKSNG